MALSYVTVNAGFPALTPAAILVMLGFRTVLLVRVLRGGQVALDATVVLLCIVIYSTYVLRYWATAVRLIRDIDPLFRWTAH